MYKKRSLQRPKRYEVKRFTLAADTELDGRVYPRGTTVWRNGHISFVQLGRDLEINGIIFTADSILWLYESGMPRAGTIAATVKLSKDNVLPRGSEIYLDTIGNIVQVTLTYPVKFADTLYEVGTKLHLDIKDGSVMTAERPVTAGQGGQHRYRSSSHGERQAPLPAMFRL